MAGEIYEWYGYRVTDGSPAATAAATQGTCPFVVGPCTKPGGVCSVKPQASQEIIPVCPKRMYYAAHYFAREIAAEAFAGINVQISGDGLPSMVPGNQAVNAAHTCGQPHVGLFGNSGWGGEVRLPPLVEGTSRAARYSVDYTLIAVDPLGELLAFVPLEVQSIDTTGSYLPSVAALQNGRQVVQSNFNLNFENVNKRILPQLIMKGLILQGEAKCTTGIYFITPEPVYARLVKRLGGAERLRRIPQQPGSITFIRYVYETAAFIAGQPMPLKRLEPVTISTSDMSLAFISPQNLPAAGAYETEIMKKL